MRHYSPAVLAAALIIGGLLRTMRVCARWDELTLAYAAYMEPLAESLGAGHPTALLGSWIGLHPPLYWATSCRIESSTFRSIAFRMSRVSGMGPR